MKRRAAADDVRPRFFFATAPMPCPYIEGRVERRLVAELAGDAGAAHDRLSLAGFRRSHGIIYAPACPGCCACKAARMRAAGFSPGRSQRAVIRRNADLSVSVRPPEATAEQFALFRAYQNARHPGGDMSRMNETDFRALIEETPVETFTAEFRTGGENGRLLAVCLADKTAGGLSAVYSFFDPDPAFNRRSLGVYMIIWLAQRARNAGLAHVYLGYWIKDCAKMGYKAGFRPLEVRTPAGWRLLEDAEAEGLLEDAESAPAPGALSPLSAPESSTPAAASPSPARP